jgi:hypothetical protein
MWNVYKNDIDIWSAGTTSYIIEVRQVFCNKEFDIKETTETTFLLSYIDIWHQWSTFYQALW